MKKILVIQTAFPGDAILTLPAIQFIKEQNNDSEIDVLCIPSTSSIFSSSPFVNNVIVLDKKNAHKSFYQTIRFAKKLTSYDEVISFHRSFRSSLISYFTGTRVRIGFKNASFGFLYTELRPYMKNMHEIERNLIVAGWDGTKKYFPVINVSGSEKERIDKFISGFKNNEIIAIAPGTIWETKRYPSNYFKKIADKLANGGFEILLIGSKADESLCESIKEGNDKLHNLAGKFSIPESVYLLSKCKLVISNDSAPTHMAVAANIKVLTIFCSTVPEFGFYPYRNGKVVQIENLPCKPCGIHGHKKCPEGHFKCGNDLDPDKILNETLKMVANDEES